MPDWGIFKRFLLDKWVKDQEHSKFIRKEKASLNDGQEEGFRR